MYNLSIVIPLLDEEKSLKKLIKEISDNLEKSDLKYEILFIDDGSSDLSWKIIKKISEKDKRVKGFRFAKNNGKSSALNFGFQKTTGKYVLTMDADIQDPPEQILEFYSFITNKNYDLVSGWKKNRKDPIEKKWPSWFFNFVTRLLSGIAIHDFNCGMKIYRSEVVKNIYVYGELHRFIPVIVKTSGFKKIGEIAVKHRKREFGKSKFGVERYLNGFLDLLTVLVVSKFGRRPMHFFGIFGIFSLLIGFIATVSIIWEKLNNLGTNIKLREVVDQPLFYVSLTLFVVGVQIFLTGFLAELFLNYSTHKKDISSVEELNT